MTRQVEEMSTDAGPPYLYWALTSLPVPLVPLRKPLQGEKKLWLDAEFPEFRTIGNHSGFHPGKEQRGSAEPSKPLLCNGEGVGRSPRASLGCCPFRGLLGIAMKVYPAAKRALIAEGR